MINITITAETAEEFRNTLLTLLGENKTVVTYGTVYGAPKEEQEEKAPSQEKAPATRTRAKVEKVAEATLPPEAGKPEPPEEPPAPVSNDLLDSPAPLTATVLNGQASLLDTPAASAPTLKPGDQITLEILRAKIAPIAQSNKQAVKDIIAQYQKADGQPAERPSDLQEKDYALVYNAIDFI